ncbi:uncharacterized protein C18orf19 homolog A [Lepisosteus oculatus]|uniref:Family with sequence similarity 210 member Ab n=1 Tax=Lepisosteus oculatus TaxID=7918 RepID=W5MTG0_LEPOC|nr:PREDICTED: protein FAM210A [Lepisosteus oculatus]
MQRLLLQTVLRQVHAARPLLLCPTPGPAGGVPPGGPCKGWLSPSRRWVSASSARTAAEPRKAGINDEPPPVSPQGALGATGSDPPPGAAPETEADPLQDTSSGLYQRFKKTFKQYGKVMIPVHLVTSTVWFGSFYYAAMKGVNLVPFLEFVGLPERLVSMLKDSQSGYALTAYAMYKIATPARYTVTLGGTSYSVKYLRKHGYLSTPPPVRDYIQDKMEETRERLSEKMEETKERITEKMEETKDKFTETKDKFSEKLQETKDKVAFRRKK